MLLIGAREYEKSTEEFALALAVYMQKHVPIVLNITEPVGVRTEVVCKAQQPGSVTRAAHPGLVKRVGCRAAVIKCDMAENLFSWVKMMFDSSDLGNAW